MLVIDVNKLLELAGDEAVCLAEELYDFNYYLDRHFDLKLFLENELVEKEKRKEIVNSIFADSSGIFRELIRFLIDEELVRKISWLSEKYIKLVAKNRDLRFATLETAFPLGKDDLSRIKECFGSNIILRVEEKPELLGGFTLRFSDGKTFDASLEGRLSKLQVEMAR